MAPSFNGKYHGQCHFAGRLVAPLPEVTTVDAARRWIEAHPGGALIVYFRDARALATFEPVATQRTRGQQVALVRNDEALRAVTMSKPPVHGPDEPDAAGDDVPRP